jgi:adenine-specific DNA-methyltransferase
MASIALPSGQSSLFEDARPDLVSHEDPAFLSKQLITYIGNKRSLAPNLERAILDVRKRLGGRPLVSADLFAGSGFVARLLKQHSSLVIANDLESYSTVANACYLANHDPSLATAVGSTVEDLNRRANAGESHPGFIREMYSPVDDRDIQLGERVFYTADNARRLDFFAQEIAKIDEPVRSQVLAPLLSRASMHANTSGVFKGFYKDKHTGIGKFGAAAGDALKRILEPIRLETPILSRYNADCVVVQGNANAVIADLPECDLIYLDPPYNQHPYGSNYFMLNLLVNYERPTAVSNVSGIPTDWTRSGYNVRKQTLPLMKDLFARAPARFLLVSFNAEGYVGTDELKAALEAQGQVNEIVVPYNTFRGSRNLRGRSIHVNEHLFLLDREA